MVIMLDRIECIQLLILTNTYVYLIHDVVRSYKLQNKNSIHNIVKRIELSLNRTIFFLFSEI